MPVINSDAGRSHHSNYLTSNLKNQYVKIDRMARPQKILQQCEFLATLVALHFTSVGRWVGRL